MRKGQEITYLNDQKFWISKVREGIIQQVDAAYHSPSHTDIITTHWIANAGNIVVKLWKYILK